MFDSVFLPAGERRTNERRRSSYLSIGGLDNIFNDFEHKQYEEYGMDSSGAEHHHGFYDPYDQHASHLQQPQSLAYAPNAAYYSQGNLDFTTPFTFTGRRSSLISLLQPQTNLTDVVVPEVNVDPTHPSIVPHPSSPTPTLKSGFALGMSPKGSGLASRSDHMKDVPDGRKRKSCKKYGKVISTIKSSRAKPAQTFVCSEIPKKDSRVKGAVYQIGEERKKWDGRQWRRLCVVQDCCSAARGATDFCIVHGRGSITKTVIKDEEVEILLANKESEDGRSVLDGLGSFQGSNLGSQKGIQSKRKSDDISDASGGLSKAIKTMKIHSASSPKGAHQASHGQLSHNHDTCRNMNTLGDICGNPTLANSPYCYACNSYLHQQQ